MSSVVTGLPPHPPEHVPSRRRRYLQRRIAVGSAVLVILAIVLYLPFSLLAPLGVAQRSVTPPPPLQAAAAQLAWPGFGASAFGAVGYPDLLSVSGTEEALPMASITKIITAMVVLDAKPLAKGADGPEIVFSAADRALYSKYTALRGTVKPMPVGASMSQHEVLQVALMASANNYAEAIADWAFGTEDAYVGATKTWLAEHGLSHTTVLEPTGINPANTSTATDLVALGKLAMGDPVIADIVDTPTLTLPEVGTIKDTNQLLGSDGVVGIKTGTLENVGSSLLFASKQKIGSSTVTIIGAVLGAPDHDTLYPAVSGLLRSIASGFHEITLADKGQVFANYRTAWSATTSAKAVSGAKVLVWGNTPVSAAVSVADIRLVSRGEKAGVVTFTVGENQITVPLAFSASLVDPGAGWRLVHPFGLGD
ncbi:D-alanyl-D-alanine carboxypeptidase family protein [Lacisediminihabitans changchengi]|uniref:D-alanyl-D-alanine carboxypeptidase n=1 Tax=Lacisediminihabitans changchengi TaxID=2787634 RepID=A0A934SRN7_9MICO|nr:D-alanyl-D-alanine carboxypeptidase [Lacisediminihabitans changchengi]MBK4346889.1 D-alanyl-D-alanine carboxypeptidase [Lacisediminihabitans changchengi]MBK4347988.1 D-alanyl-D-alanine carboxypeptidase [Lacisediminihabitans changchengi]